MSSPPRLSIVTVCRNAEAPIKRTLESLRGLRFRDFEYIAIDGLSTDGTVEAVRKWGPPGARVISEKDAGIYDAMNKGLRMATGEFVWFLNAGDTLHDPAFLDKLDWRADFYYGGVVILDGARVVKRSLPKAWFPAVRSVFGQIACHQSMLVRRSAAPLYDLSYRLVSDMDWSIRILKTPGLRKSRSGEYWVNYELDGTSTRNADRCWEERKRIVAAHFGAWTRPLSALLHAWFRFKAALKARVRA